MNEKDLKALNDRLATLEKDLKDRDEKLAQANEKAEQLDQLNALLSTPEGVKQIQTKLTESARAAGWIQDPTPVDSQFDMDGLTDVEKKLVEYMQKQQQAYDSGLKKLEDLFHTQNGQTQRERIAHTSVDTVKAELGLSLTPQQLFKVMSDVNTDDPVEACMRGMKKEVIAALKAPQVTVKPNHITQTPSDLDTSKMTFEERLELFKSNSEIAQAEDDRLRAGVATTPEPTTVEE